MEIIKSILLLCLPRLSFLLLILNSKFFLNCFFGDGGSKQITFMKNNEIDHVILLVAYFFMMLTLHIYMSRAGRVERRATLTKKQRCKSNF